MYITWPALLCVFLSFSLEGVFLLARGGSFCWNGKGLFCRAVISSHMNVANVTGSWVFLFIIKLDKRKLSWQGRVTSGADLEADSIYVLLRRGKQALMLAEISTPPPKKKKTFERLNKTKCKKETKKGSARPGLRWATIPPPIRRVGIQRIGLVVGLSPCPYQSTCKLGKELN